MQLNLINFLFGTTFSGAAAAQGGQGAGGGDLFSQLLGDAGQGGAGGQGQYGLKGGDLAAGALIAQEIDPQQLALLQQGNTEQLAQLLGQQIGPDEARAMLAQLDQLQQQAGDGSGEAFDQLKEALQTIEGGGDSMDVAGLLDSLPAVADAAGPAERAPLVKRMLGWVHAAMERKESVQQAAAVQDSTALSLQASMFRSGDDAAAAATAEASDDAKEKAAQTVTQIIPLAQPMLAMPEWVRKLGNEQAGGNDADAALDEAIPSLALAPTDDEELPDVKLPGATARALAATHDVSAPKASQAFSEHLRPLPAAANEVEAATAPLTQIEVAGVQGLGGVHSTTTHGLSSPHAPATTAYMPHVPVSEQVHVAITRAKQDGIDNITLQLEPADLGRVEVKMDIAADGKAHLSFLVDKADTLDALSRDARGLERMLQEAGVKADAGSMQFNLRQQPQPQFSGDMQGQGSNGQPANDNDEEAKLTLPPTSDGITTHYTLNVREGVDIRA